MILRERFLALKQTVAIETIGSTGLSYTADETSKMPIHRGVIHDFSENVKGVKKKDEVLYNKSRAFDLKLEGETYTIIREEDIVLIV